MEPNSIPCYVNLGPGQDCGPLSEPCQSQHFVSLATTHDLIKLVGPKNLYAERSGLIEKKCLEKDDHYAADGHLYVIGRVSIRSELSPLVAFWSGA